MKDDEQRFSYKVDSKYEEGKLTIEIVSDNNNFTVGNISTILLRLAFEKIKKASDDSDRTIIKYMKEKLNDIAMHKIYE